MGLYPLKFKPIYKQTIWGGEHLQTTLKKDLGGLTGVGESWEISDVQDNISVVANGSLEGNNLQELTEIYMGDLVGDKVFERFGQEFPLLIKFIDANDDLSIQVHPDDMVAAERHHAFGKTEMWYALDGSDNTKLVTGFNKDIDQNTFLEKLKNNTLTEVLNYETVHKGDAFFVPAGRVHAICKNNLIAEIQQTSDVTYRVYDYDRRDKNGNGRDLHVDLSLDVIDYTQAKNPRIKYDTKVDMPNELVSCQYFTTNLLCPESPVVRDYYKYDSFAILIGVEGKFELEYEGGNTISLNMGETILLPASIPSIKIKPEETQSRLLEIYIK